LFEALGGTKVRDVKTSKVPLFEPSAWIRELGVIVGNNPTRPGPFQKLRAFESTFTH
jgi:hypothetical protein